MQASSWRRFYTGVLGGTVILAITLASRILLNSPFLPEAVAGKIFATVPGEVESFVVLVLGSYAKYLTVIGISIVLAVLYGLYGILFTRFDRRFDGGGKISKGLIYSLPPWLFHAVAVLSLDGVYASLNLANILLYLLLAHLAYGATLGAFYPKPPLEEAEVVKSESKGRARRIFIRKVAPAAIGIAILIYGIDRFLLPLLGTSRFTEETLEEMYSKEVTPTEEFYRTDIAVIPPNVNVSEWRLTIGGQVENPTELTYDQLKSLPSVQEFATLECISNPVGGSLIGTALWEGVRLSTVLEEAKVKPGAKYVIFYSVDGYSVAIPLETALKEGTVLAYNMNSEELNSIHGFPIRAVVPGIFGMMNAKWIRGIELVAEEYLGYWQTRGWSNEADIETTSVIKIPQAAARLSGFTPIAGIAFAGDREISKVEVSTDGGETWSQAMLKDSLSKYTWILWDTEWIPKEDGRHAIKVRATDKAGRVQTSQLRGTYPDGATGYHVIDVVVESSPDE